MNRRAAGSQKERVAADYLMARGVEILAKNYAAGPGEIDLVGRDGAYVVFIEVKWRAYDGSGYAAEAVTKAKQRTICAVSLRYLMAHHYGVDTAVRYDVVAIDGEEVSWIQDAFPYIP